MTKVANVMWAAIAMAAGCFGLAACSSSSSPPQAQTAVTSSTTRQQTVAAPAASVTPPAPAAPSPPAPCLGLSVCPPPPPDAEGNAACSYRNGWDADPSGSEIDVNYFPEASVAANGEQVTVDVRLKDGSVASQIAAIEPGQSFRHIHFPGIDKSTVQEVLLTTSAGRCFIIGPNGSTT